MTAGETRWNQPLITVGVPVVLTILAFVTRFYNIGWSDQVVWDEAHFGKFASYYLKREFYFDVHPPLGKMLLGFSGVLSNYTGSFNFESGKKYPENVNYASMRRFCAFFGAAMIPLAYATSREMGLSKRASTLAGLMVLCDTAYIAITRFILLDSMLLFFTVLSAYCFACFHATEKDPFSFEWWYWMAMTGLALGCVLSVKWVGLFAVAMVGLYTVWSLWELLAEKDFTWTEYAWHWIARIVCLIMLPMVVYLAAFKMHFIILNRSGSGDANMSSLFQAGLKGIDLDSNPLDVVYGSVLTIKNNGHGGGLLHSHVQRYPSGSEQQQVTCYHHKDTNNDWTIAPNWDRTHAMWKKNGRDEIDMNQEPIEFIKDGEVVRLVHLQTGRNLHSHPVKAPITTRDYEVSCYGNATVGDHNDHWKVEIVDDAYDRKPDHIKALTTRFRLRHVVTGCLLKGHNVNLPQWGFKQLETTCDRFIGEGSRNVIWNVEKHTNPRLPPGPKNAFRSRFMKDFVDHNVGMWTTNNALTPDPDKEPDQLVSSPPDWPLASVGLRMCGWDDNSIKYFLLGHPLVWWGGAASIVGIVLVSFVYLARMQRGAGNWQDSEWKDFVFGGFFLCFMGWFLHYVPFFVMGRVTYLHHYFPALYFAILCFCFLFDHLSLYAGEAIRDAAFAVLASAVVGVFWFFKDFALGFTGPAQNYANRQWLNTWNFYD